MSASDSNKKMLHLEVCPHDLAERESACADGMCPICLDDRLAAIPARARDDARHARVLLKYAELPWSMPEVRDALNWLGGIAEGEQP